jgi:hypothetical protein
MNNDVENLLREGMERFTKDLRAPAGLTRHAVQRRRRRRVLRSIAGSASVLAAGAVALVAVVVPGTVENGTPALASAYVMKRVDSALSAAEPGDIAQVMVTSSGAGPGIATKTTSAEEWSYGDQWRSVTYSSAGQPDYDEGSSASSVYTLVSYSTRTWARQRHLGNPIGLEQPGKPVAGNHPVGNRAVQRGAPALGPRGCEPTGGANLLLLQPGLPGMGFSASAPPATAARALGKAVSCGIFTVAGRQRVDGIEAIELKSRPGSFVTETIWVGRGTDLPIRVVVHSSPGEPAFKLTADITWLRPTTQNLANLNVPIPAGFHRVPLAEAIGQTLLQFSGGQKPKKICLGTGAGPECQH